MSKGKYAELKKVKAEMILRDIKLMEMAESIGATEQTMRDKLTGKSELKRSEIKSISEQFQIPLAYFFED